MKDLLEENLGIPESAVLQMKCLNLTHPVSERLNINLRPKIISTPAVNPIKNVS